MSAINKLDDADTSELIAGAFGVIHVWKTLLNGNTRQKPTLQPPATGGAAATGQRRPGRKAARRAA